MTTRTAVKAVIRSGDELLLMHSPAAGDYKFPGGGVRDGETHAIALARELGEECGRALEGLDDLLVTVVERRADALDPGAEFQAVSYYYACRVSETRTGRLDDYEAALGLTAVMVRLDDALVADETIAIGPDAPPWTAREAIVLRWLADHDSWT